MSAQWSALDRDDEEMDMGGSKSKKRLVGGASVQRKLRREAEELEPMTVKVTLSGSELAFLLAGLGHVNMYVRGQKLWHDVSVAGQNATKKEAKKLAQKLLDSIDVLGDEAQGWYDETKILLEDVYGLRRAE